MSLIHKIALVTFSGNVAEFDGHKALIREQLESAVNISKQSVWGDHRANHVGYYANILVESGADSFDGTPNERVDWTQVGKEIIKELTPQPPVLKGFELENHFMDRATEEKYFAFPVSHDEFNETCGGREWWLLRGAEDAAIAFIVCTGKDWATMYTHAGEAQYLVWTFPQDEVTRNYLESTPPTGILWKEEEAPLK